MNSAVRLVVSALWTVAYVLIDVDADYSSRPILDPTVISASGATATTPSHAQLRNWLARRFLSPPILPRLGTT